MIALLILGGLLAGALINLFADSLPTARRLRRPACDYCGRPRPAVAWSAVTAYLTGRQRCPSCAAPLSLRHVVVELAATLLYVLVWLQTGTTSTTALHILYGSVFLLVLVTDLEHRLILHMVMLPAIGLALAGAFINPAFDSPMRALLGGAIGLVVGMLLYLGGKLFAHALGRMRGEPIAETALGFGDVTLLTFIGLVVGAPEILLALVIGILSGGIFAGLYLLVRGLVQRRYALYTAIPYGPFLILGGATMLYFGQYVMAWYTRG
jgi:prepilin signal peptidase PulO-like enzyme (type II secretory pathway)